MQCFVGGRFVGKTTWLIMKSCVTGVPIMAPNMHMAKLIEHQAKRMGLQIKPVLSYRDLLTSGKTRADNRVLVDELVLFTEQFLGTRIVAATISGEPVTPQVRSGGEGM